MADDKVMNTVHGRFEAAANLPIDLEVAGNAKGWIEDEDPKDFDSLMEVTQVLAKDHDNIRKALQILIVAHLIFPEDLVEAMNLAKSL